MQQLLLPSECYRVIVGYVVKIINTLGRIAAISQTDVAIVSKQGIVVGESKGQGRSFVKALEEIRLRLTYAIDCTAPSGCPKKHLIALKDLSAFIRRRQCEDWACFASEISMQAFDAKESNILC